MKVNCFYDSSRKTIVLTVSHESDTERALLAMLNDCNAVPELVHCETEDNIRSYSYNGIKIELKVKQ